jgi:hypothetical protein
MTLKCRSIDHIFLQAYVPKLQSVGQVCNFLHRQRGFPIPSSAAFGKIGDRYVKDIHAFAKERGIPVVHFGKGQSKEKFARPYLEAAAQHGEDRVVLIGIAQEKASVWRSWKAKGQEHLAHPHMEWGGKWPTSTTTTSTSGIRSWVRRSGKPTFVRRTQSGCD